MNHLPWTKFDPEDFRQKPSWMKNAIPCPKCQGHCSCIVTENAYGPGQHFKYACTQCGGMMPLGWVEANSKDSQCVHEFIGKNLGRGLTIYTCVKCNTQQTIDSGD